MLHYYYFFNFVYWPHCCYCSSALSLFALSLHRYYFLSSFSFRFPFVIYLLICHSNSIIFIVLNSHFRFPMQSNIVAIFGNKPRRVGPQYHGWIDIVYSTLEENEKLWVFLLPLRFSFVFYWLNTLLPIKIAFNWFFIGFSLSNLSEEFPDSFLIISTLFDNMLIIILTGRDTPNCCYT